MARELDSVSNSDRFSFSEAVWIFFVAFITFVGVCLHLVFIIHMLKEYIP